jgi:hypothetical protein
MCTNATSDSHLESNWQKDWQILSNRFHGLLYFNQNAGILEAAKNGKITKISTVDIKYKNVLGFVQTYETTVTGD